MIRKIEQGEIWVTNFKLKNIILIIKRMKIFNCFYFFIFT